MATTTHNEETIYEDVTLTVAWQEGVPVKITVTAEDQRGFVEGGYGTAAELIDMEASSYRDWQSDC